MTFFFLCVLMMWMGIFVALPLGRIWWTAVQTGRWLLRDGRGYYFPSKYYTFSIYDRTNNPGMYRLAVIGFPILLAGWLLLCILPTIFLVHALLAPAPAKGQTPDPTPRVRGFFSYGPETCKKRCADDTACFKECMQHELTPDELRDIINQQKQQPRK
jgi:hypothetical protein